MRGHFPSAGAWWRNLQLFPSDKTTYRSDIDGLRAISVVAVLLFHLSPRHAPAGAIGVDVFFVISGYLIGGMLLDQFERGTFSYADFYMRRIRRIMPALLVMNLATLAAGFVFFYPAELVELAASGLSSLIGFANVYFYIHSDYFADNDWAGFLHTWSLGVEEQFYILLPPLIALSIRLFGGRALIGIGATLIVSLIMSEAGVRAHSTGAFYLIHSRAWELAIGVIVSGRRISQSLSSLRTVLAALLGALLTVGSLILLRPDRGFPGFAAIPPCLGAALLLVSGAKQATIVHKLLSFAPLRLIGLASYSIYLWHWPVIVFVHAYRIAASDVMSIITASILSIVLGLASWRFVETPFRRSSLSSSRVLIACGGMAGLSGALSLAILLTGGFPARMDPHVRKLAEMRRDGPGFAVPKDHCFTTAVEPLARYDAGKCLALDPRRPNWLLVGDSHAAMLYDAMVRAYPGVHIMPAVSYGCEIRIDAPDDGMACNGLWHMIFATYLKTAPIDGVILTSRWGFVDEPALQNLAKRLLARHIKVLLMGPTPDYTASVPRILAEAERRHDPGIPRRMLQPRVWDMEAALKRVSQASGIPYASPLGAMCNAQAECVIVNGQGLPLYTDGSHYSLEGATLVVSRLRAKDESAGNPLARTLGERNLRDRKMGASAAS